MPADDVPGPWAVFRFAAIGTGWQIDIPGARYPTDCDQQIVALTKDFDRVWSRFRAESLITPNR